MVSGSLQCRDGAWRSRGSARRPGAWVRCEATSSEWVWLGAELKSNKVRHQIPSVNQVRRGRGGKKTCRYREKTPIRSQTWKLRAEDEFQCDICDTCKLGIGEHVQSDMENWPSQATLFVKLKPTPFTTNTKETCSTHWKTLRNPFEHHTTPLEHHVQK